MPCSFPCKWRSPMEAVKRVGALRRPRQAALHTFVLVLLVPGGPFAAFAGDTIVPGEGISGNQTLVSKNGEFELGFFSPGAGIHRFLGVRFKKKPTTSPTFWVGNGLPITDLSGVALEVFGGSLCIKEAGASLWCSSVAGDGPPPAGATARLLGNGNLVVTDQANSSRILWQSFDSPGDSLLLGGRLGFDRDTGSNIFMTYMDYPHNGSISVNRSRRNGFVLTTDGHDSFGTFPDWMVTSQAGAGPCGGETGPRPPLPPSSKTCGCPWMACSQQSLRENVTHPVANRPKVQSPKLKAHLLPCR
ncbi:hypothetical protein PVAP13_5NG021908 [Panicum virgatum]|uniref:non-specific serine/threonine protein kinase n=1 Tax=Panicum virgatum TaxID=38727 RepID=A0A8T0RLR3_PANVG|nr:hypothetical protein PVAP13_5NG021908 [Panicum virgatum]